MENITANVQSLTGNLALDTIVSGLITLVVCYIAIRIVKALVAKALGKATKLELPVKNLINKAVTFVLWAVAIIIVAGAFGINSASLVALLSVVGLALSMSVQGLLGNFFSGILLLINKPFKEGDFVEAGDKVGVIKSIGFFNTTINTLDNVSMVVPNGDLTGATVKNYSREPLRRVDMTFCTSYDVSTEDAKKAILDAIAKDERILAEYPYHAFIDLNGDGVPVLIISTTEDDFITDADRAAVYVYADGEAKNVLEVGGGGGDIFYANLDEKTLTHFSRLSGERHIEVFHVEDGALKPVTHADYYGPHHYPEQDSEDPLYFQDYAPVAEAEGETLFELYTAEDAAVTYEPMA